MSAKFVPQAGMYFYVAVRSFEREVDDNFGNVKTLMVQDRSYRGDVFYCMATDDSYIVAERVLGGISYEPHLFSRMDHDFDPIGPDVMRVLSQHFKHKYAKPAEQDLKND